MASTFNLSNAAANTQANAQAASFNDGYLNVYSGAQPASANDALSGNTLLASLRFPSPAFGSAVNGVITANALTAVDAVATGTVSFVRCLESDGATVICDGSIGVSNADWIVNSTSIITGQPVQPSSFTYTVTE